MSTTETSAIIKSGKSDEDDTKMSSSSDGEKVAPVSVKKEVDEDIGETLNKDEAAEENGAFAYLNRNEFTSERFKLEVYGLPRYYGFSELRKLFINKLKVSAHKLIPPKKGCTYMFVNFKSEEDRQTALQKINGFVWKKKTLSAKLAKAVEDPLVKRKRKNEDVDSGQAGFVGNNEPVAVAIRRITTPWWDVPYNEQLDRKMTIIRTVFKEMKTGIHKAHPQIKDIAAVLQENIVETIRPSPLVEKYRNKCEFSIGYNPENKERTVGFRLSSYKKGSIAVGPFDDLCHLPDAMKKCALKFQDFIRQSKYDVYDPETHAGCFRQLTVRVTINDDVMMMVVLSKKELSEEEFNSLKEEMKLQFSAETSFNLKSFYLKLLNEYGNPDNNDPELLFGSSTITEKLLDHTFEISPEAFFQINVPATEILYKIIGDLIKEQGDATLLDVCCGTGTIGISLSAYCSEVLGIEMVPSAVVDARKNAQINGLTEKCDFFAGKAEDLTELVIQRAKSKNIIAVVDPPRAGLHQKVLFSLRKCEKIETLIYVACNAKAAMKNFIDLCRPTSNAFRGNPFIPVKLIPVDMFPFIPHFELIIVFSRLDKVTQDTPTIPKVEK